MRTLAALLIGLGLAAGLGQAAPAGPGGPGGLCGLPDVHPLWIDYAEGSVSFRNDVFGRPGVVAATSGTINAGELRNRGAHTVYWWMKLNRIAGTPSAPTEPSTVAAGITEVVDKAIAATGCETPVVVLNELNSAGSTTPWTATNARYRENVLEALRGIAARGAHPLLLISARPYTGGDALGWWQQAGQVANIVREVYFPAPPLMRTGAVLASRTMRQKFRQGLGPLLQAGIPKERLGLVIGFQSGPGKGGREGLQPTTAWLRFAKLLTLAAKQVAGELGVGSVVTWGWGTFDQAGADDDKPKAACVYLWARDPSLCDGPAAAGPGFNASLDEGQIALPPATRCRLDGKTIPKLEVKRLAALTGDPQVALSALFARLVEGHPVDPSRVLALEETIVSVRFGGSRTAYLNALRSRGASLVVARAIIADQLRRQDIAKKRRVEAPTPGAISRFHALYGSLPVRQVRADDVASWLGGRRRGFALVPPGPLQLLTLPTDLPASLVTTNGPVEVTALDEVLPLAAVPLGLARPAVRAALTAQARLQAVETWSVGAQSRALSRILCVGDVLPTAETVDLAAYLPFLALDA
ncbi:MAG TPA: hypothetical protein VFR32_09525 [Gaiellaceae bacterium]|nr:hypothetical protein [Gaiellaceae bacterium]